MRFLLAVLGIAMASSTVFAMQTGPGDGANWSSYYGSPGNDHYSPLKQITTTNVSQLKEAWRFDTGEEGGLETTPLVVDGVLYALTPTQHVIALDGRTGKLKWTFDSGVKATGPNRGLTFWRQGRERRLFAGIMHRLYAIDPDTGKAVKTFGANGYVDLREGLGREPASQSIALTSPGVIYKDMIIVGGREPESLPAPPGDIRAYDVRTGKQRWIFHTIPHPGEAGYETWPDGAWKTAGAANNWTGMAVDAENGIVYVPTGSAAPDFYGGARKGDDLYANCLLALDATTGKLRWYFQGVHHDVWDRDFPSPPTLLTVQQKGVATPVVAVTSKQGLLFVFNRLTGQPLFPMEQRAVTPSTIPGEVAAPMQPIPTAPEPFARQSITEEMLTTRTPEAHAWAVEEFRKLRHVFPYDPFRLDQDTLMMPSFEGGGEWGGVASDPRSGVLFVNANDYASVGGMTAHRASSSGRAMYLKECGACHGVDRLGSPPAFPSLAGVDKKLSTDEITQLLHQGKGRMPSFPSLQGADLKRLMDYLRTGVDDEKGSGAIDEAGVVHSVEEGEGTIEYSMKGYRRFLDPEGYPAVAAPWGTLSAINLNTGKYVWKRPLGEYPELAKQGVKETGTENYGGPLVTGGGVLFIAATNFDHKFRAFDETNGHLLWETVLPFAGNATPATYQAGGKQYVVIGAGGGLMMAKGRLGGVYIAYALSN